MYEMCGIASLPLALANEALRFGQMLADHAGLLPTAAWAVIVAAFSVGLTFAAAALGAGLAFLGGHLARRQTTKQIELQTLMSHRTTAAFVAEKRHKWIDELRTDMAFYLALSQEIVWKWDAIRKQTAIRVEAQCKDSKGRFNSAKANSIRQTAADAFSVENGARDREHQERHIRILLRLNPSKLLQVMLRAQLDQIRAALIRTQGAETDEEAEALLELTINLVKYAQNSTQAVLKAEWQRVKQEVAYPDALMSTIEKPPSGSAKQH